MNDTPALARKRGGRPRIGAARRDQLVQIRVTPDEAADLAARATAAGLNVSDYLRQSARDARHRTIARRIVLDPITIHRLALLGSNVNQIARVLNATGNAERADCMDELVTEIRSLLDAVRSHVR